MLVTDQAQLEQGPETFFHVVLAVPPHGDGWQIQGVFTKPDDAKVCQDDVQRKPGWEGAFTERMTLDAIRDQLFDERLAALAPLIKAALKLPTT